jgi:hypothetical protein
MDRERDFFAVGGWRAIILFYKMAISRQVYFEICGDSCR